MSLSRICMRAVDSWTRGGIELATKQSLKRGAGGYKILMTLITQFSSIVIIQKNWIQAGKGNTNKIIVGSTIVFFIF